MQVWIEKGLHTSVDLKKIDKRTRAFYVPNNMGRLPVNISISSNYGGFKAAQWQLWVIVYAAVVPKGLLPDNHLQNWLVYVRACYITWTKNYMEG